jgi:hypothetical protein
MPKQHDPGGKVRLAIRPDVKGPPPVFGGPNDCYRYRLTRTWDKTKPHAMFIMMNPSTADERWDDRSVRRCEDFARAWDYGGIYVGNTFAYRATDKKKLRAIPNPVGPDNDKHLIAMAKLAEIVIFAYGQPGHRKLRDRGQLLAKILSTKASGRTSSNSPRTARRAIRCTSVRVLSPFRGSGGSTKGGKQEQWGKASPESKPAILHQLRRVYMMSRNALKIFRKWAEKRRLGESNR